MGNAKVQGHKPSRSGRTLIRGPKPAPDQDPGELKDADFVLHFEQGSLPPSLFDHRAHLRLAWIYLDRYGEAGAIDRTCRGLRAFAQRQGEAEKFHMTLTVASVKILWQHMKCSKALHFLDLIREVPKLRHSFRELLGRHYSETALNDPGARREYRPPDRLPFGQGGDIQG